MTIDRDTFFAQVRKTPFPGKLKQTQVDGMNTILSACEDYPISDARQIAYVLATVFWETDNTMQPIKEAGGARYLRSKKYYPYYGRGFIQLTWKANYQKFADKLHMPELVTTPDCACSIQVAASVMTLGMVDGLFTGKKLSDYFNANECDWVGARRIINGIDKNVVIAGYAKQFYADIVSAF